MYTCKQIRDIVKARLKYEPRVETVQDADYFDLIKRGLKKFHRILIAVNYNYYKKIHKSYTIHSFPDHVVAFPSDLHKVISWKMHPTASIGDGIMSSTNYEESVHWCEIDTGSVKGLIQMERAKDAAHEQDIEGSLIYVREIDMPTNWASTPDLPEGSDDWLIQYLITEVMITIGNPSVDLGKLRELDSMIIQMNSEGGAAGQTAAS
tara:strand:- start:131 stop:751 length:621 start_codon:yes stop_codon:yes gene_type:complete